LLVTFIIVETVLAAIMLALAVRAQKIHSSLDIRNLSKLRG
jgi:multisubunit Na+/H+ antiporter MnhC subunit